LRKGIIPVYKGIIYSIMSGILISLQGIFNTRVSDKVGFWQANSFIKGTAFIFAFLIILITRGVNFSNIKQVNKLYLLGGIMGALIVFGVMKGISYSGASNAITIIVVSQLIFTFIVNIFGLFGEEVIQVTVPKVIGLILMVVGVVMFQYIG